jgi:hypothetical protein
MNNNNIMGIKFCKLIDESDLEKFIDSINNCISINNKFVLLDVEYSTIICDDTLIFSASLFFGDK